MSIHPRVITGHEAQQFVLNSLPPQTHIISTSTTGSNHPDLIASIDGHCTQFEIKNCNSLKSPIALISCTIKKHYRKDLIDNIISLVTDDEHQNINSLFDYHQANNKCVGFPCDYGTSRSGTLPRGLVMSADHPNMYQIHQGILTHLINNNNTYLVLVCRNPQITIHTFYTGYGTNVLNAPSVPNIKTARITTYGIAALDKMRLALKVTFDGSIGTVNNVPGKYSISN